MIVTGYTNAGEAVKKIILDIGIEECEVDASAPKPFVDVTFKSKEDMRIYQLTDNNQYIAYGDYDIIIRCKVE